MSANLAKNPISLRLDLMAEIWRSFEKDSSALVGRWLVADDEYRMVQAFVRKEDTEAGEVPSVFFELTSSFSAPQKYGTQLLEEMVNRCLELGSLEELLEAGMSESFIRSFENKQDPNAWLDFLAGFYHQVKELNGHIVVFLSPHESDNEEAYIKWLLDLMESGVPEGIRIMLADLKRSPRYDKLETYNPNQINTLEPHLNMPAAMMEMASEPGQGDPNDPAIKFRKAYVGLLQHNQPAQFEQAKEFARMAQEIAQEQGWHHLEVAIYMGLASIMLNNQIFEGLFENYEKARVAASKSESEDKTTGKRLAVQAWIGEGAARIAQQDYETAMQAFQAGAPIAESIEDHILALESWRMAGFCAAKESIWIDAWEFNQKALFSGQQLPSDQCQNTTLAYVGQALLELVDKSGQSNQEKYKILDAMESMLGKDWQQTLNSN